MSIALGVLIAAAAMMLKRQKEPKSRTAAEKQAAYAARRRAYTEAWLVANMAASAPTGPQRPTSPRSTPQPGPKP